MARGVESRRWQVDDPDADEEAKKGRGPHQSRKEEEPERRSNATARQEAARAKAAAYEKIRADEIARTTKAEAAASEKAQERAQGASAST